MKFYDPSQRLDYIYIRKEAEKELLIYLRSSMTAYLPGGVILSNSTAGRTPAWTLDFYPGINNAVVSPYYFEKMELILLGKTSLPKETDPRFLEAYVKKEVEGLLADFRIFTVTCNVYNERRTLEGQVTNTISNSGDVGIL